MGVRHPSLWMFIRKMKDEERRDRLHFRREKQGKNEMKLKGKWCCLERRIKRIRREYCARVRPLPEYRSVISYAIKNYR